MILILIFLKLSLYIEARNVIIHSHHNKILVGHSYRNISHVDQTKCLEHCLKDCLCRSFQICPADQHCQLSNYSAEFDSRLLQDSQGCDYSDFEYHGTAEVTQYTVYNHVTLFLSNV